MSMFSMISSNGAPARDGLAERVEVHDHEIDRDDARPPASPSRCASVGRPEDAAVDARVQRLDAAVEDLGRAREVARPRAPACPPPRAPSPCRPSRESRRPRRVRPRASSTTPGLVRNGDQRAGNLRDFSFSHGLVSITRRTPGRERGLRSTHGSSRRWPDQARPARRRRSEISALVRSRQPPIGSPSNDSPPRRMREILRTVWRISSRPP